MNSCAYVFSLGLGHVTGIVGGHTVRAEAKSEHLADLVVRVCCSEHCCTAMTSMTSTTESVSG